MFSRQQTCKPGRLPARPRRIIEAAAPRIAVSVRDQAERVAVAERREGGQEVGVELDILKAVLQIDGIEACCQIPIVDPDVLQSPNERLKPNSSKLSE